VRPDEDVRPQASLANFFNLPFGRTGGAVTRFCDGGEILLVIAPVVSMKDRDGAGPIDLLCFLG
jgi:hypothetical protein